MLFSLSQQELPLPPAEAVATVRSACLQAATRSLHTREFLIRVRAEVAGATELSGDLRYLAPELVDPGSEPTPAADVYALGVLLFELLTGEAPGHEVPSQVDPELAPFDRLCTEALAPLTVRNPRTPDLFLAALARVPVGNGEPAPQPDRRVPAGLGARAVAGGVDVLPFFALGAAVSPVVAIVAFVLADLASGGVGWSPGKQLLGLEVVGPDGKRCGGSRGIHRTVCRWLSWLPCGLGYLFALEPGAPTLHDGAAGTQVLHRT